MSKTEPWQISLYFHQISGNAIRSLEQSDPGVKYTIKWGRSKDAQKQGESGPAGVVDGSIRWNYTAQFICGIKRNKDKLEKKILKISLKKHPSGKKVSEIFIDLSKYVERGAKEFNFPMTIPGGDKNDPAKIHVGIATSPHRPGSGAASVTSPPTEDSYSVTSRSSGVNSAASSPASTLVSEPSSSGRPLPPPVQTLPPFNESRENASVRQELRSKEPLAPPLSPLHPNQEDSRSQSKLRAAIKPVSRMGSENDYADERSQNAQYLEIARLREQIESLTNQVRMKDEDVQLERKRRIEMQRALEEGSKQGDEQTRMTLKRLRDENKQFREALEKERRERERLHWEYTRRQDELRQEIIEKEEFYTQAQRELSKPPPPRPRPPAQCMECSIM